MQLSSGMVMLVYTTAAALTGAAVTVALVRTTTPNAWVLTGRDGLRGTLAASQLPPGEGTPLPPDASPNSAAGDQQWKLSITTGLPQPSETASLDPGLAPWSTDIQPAPSRPHPKPQLRAPGSTSKASRPAKRRHGPHTLQSRLAEIGPAARTRLAAKFQAARMAWPPDEVTLIAIKDEKVVELHARAAVGGSWKRVHRYRVLAASGSIGPKLQKGDRQVPEGIYRITYLNPNSAYHVSLRVNYPSAFDRRMAAADGRHDLGGDIMIHGKRSSAGCLAMGDDAAEELFVLAAEIGRANVQLIIAPTDFRRGSKPSPKSEQPKWLPGLYTEIATAMSPFKPPPSTGLLSFFTQ